MPPQSLRDLAWNRRNSAIHEAGHVVVSRSYGLKSTGYIWPNENPNPQPDETLFFGIAHLPGVENLPREARRTIALAGAAAQMTWMRLPADQFYSNTRWLVSKSDWRDIGIVTGQSNTAVLSETLKSLMASMKRGTNGWTDLMREARQIIITSKKESDAQKFARAVREHRTTPATTASTVAA
jgi:hypothetical protein